MSIPPVCENDLEGERDFSSLYKLFVDIGQKKIDNISMDFLSMGMSDDYLLAIKHGSRPLGSDWNRAVWAQGHTVRPSMRELRGMFLWDCMDKFKNFIGIPEDEYYEDEDVDFISNDNPRPGSRSLARSPRCTERSAATRLSTSTRPPSFRWCSVKPEAV